MIPVHAFFGTDQRIDIENPAIAKRQLEFDALFQDGLKIADAKDLVKAINNSQVGPEIKILQTRALLGR